MHGLTNVKFVLFKNTSHYLQSVVFMSHNTLRYLRWTPTFSKKHASTIFMVRLAYVSRKFAQAAGEEATVELG